MDTRARSSSALAGGRAALRLLVLFLAIVIIALFCSPELGARAEPSSAPDAPELCNHVDDDGDGLVDEGFPSLTTELFLRDPENLGPFFGGDVVATGDLDGDGSEDFAVSEIGDPTRGSWEGAVLVFSGADRSLLCRATSDVALGGAQLGHSLAFLGDVDGDGTPELAAGAPYSDVASYDGGEIVVLSLDLAQGCPSIAHLRDPDAGGYFRLGFEHGVARIEDLTGDGTNEVLAGAALAKWGGLDESGTALAFDGASGAFVRRFEDPQAHAWERFGHALAGLGDIDGDGSPDVAIGAPQWNGGLSQRGAVLVFSGASGALIRRIEDPEGASGDLLGFSVAALGDVDGDGTPDLAAGARGRETAAGRDAGTIIAFSGADGAVLWRAEDPEGGSDAHLGWSLAAIPDRDMDGRVELIAGAPYAQVGGISGAGRFLVLSGAGGALLERLERADSRRDDHLGFNAGAALDLNGDGARDLVVGCTDDDIPSVGVDRGSVALFIEEADCDEDGVAIAAGDCDDQDPARHPAHEELCDGVDNDCDASVDEDEDGDGHDVCAEESAGCIAGADENPRVFPGAPELCNEVDDDCDGSIDEGPDADGDGVMAPCDCDEGDELVHPGASETCNHRADGCGIVDEGFDKVTPSERLVDRLPVAGDRFGWSIVSIGDVDGDGIPELAVGAESDDTSGWNEGQVTLISGAHRRALCRTGAHGMGQSSLGRALAATGDLDGDGTPDFAASAPGADRILLFSGADCSEIARCDDGYAMHLGLGAESGLARGPDLDGDGVDEILAGAPGASLYEHHGGAAFVFRFERASGECVRHLELRDPLLSYGESFGFALGFVDDLDGDATADLLVGEPNDGYTGDSAGSVLLFSGADGRLLRRLVDPLCTWREKLGQSVAGGDDLDGDGWPEIFAGAEMGDLEGLADRGFVTLFSGRTGEVLRRLRDPEGAAGDRLGRHLALVADRDNDGARDVLVGARYADPGGVVDAGKAVLLASSAEGLKLAELVAPDARAGRLDAWAVAAAGDLDGDGLEELAFGSPGASVEGVTEAGFVRLFSVEADCDLDARTPFEGDCDDADETLWGLPSEAREVLVAADKETFSWLPPLEPGQSADPLYDLLLADGPAAFPEGRCALADSPDTSAIVSERPSPGAVLYALARAENGCGEGPLGEWGAERWPREGRPCP